jgi:RluA family pseudouridine synthase
LFYLDYNTNFKENGEKMKLVVEKNAEGLTLEGFLKRKGFSTRLIRMYKWQGEIRVNGEKENVKRILKEGDVIELSLFDTFSDILPQEMDLSICYEDDEILIVSKPAGMVVHPTRRYREKTLANGVAYYFEKNGIKTLIRPVNRLDKGTSGIVIFAKEPFMQYYLQIVNPMSKFYYAIVHGKLEGEGIIDAPIKRKSFMAIEREVSEEGDRAITYYKSIKVTEEFTLLKVKIATGRTHQIRVHLSYIGHPIVGDDLYGKSTSYIDRPALHAYRVTFFHPLKEKIISVYDPIPEDIKRLLSFL